MTKQPERRTYDLAGTTIGSLDLKVDQAFGYWFDFGDDWWHQINVLAIDVKVPKGWRLIEVWNVSP